MKQLIAKGRAVTPSKIICIGRNYVEHIAELGNEVPDEMVVFIKPNSAIGSKLQAYSDEPLHYETEIALMVEGGEFCAVGAGLDLTRRQLQSKLKKSGLPWERAKAFDGAALFSEFVALPETIEGLRVNLKIDDTVVQDGGVELMMYKPCEILRELKKFLTLEDGDIVMTGTPKGVGELRAGASYCASVIDAADGQQQTLVSAEWVAQ